MEQTQFLSQFMTISFMLVVNVVLLKLTYFSV